MKKVAIITIVSQNYGNRLQNYALQEVVKTLGYDVETIRRFKRSFLYDLKNILHQLFNPNSTTMFWKFNKSIKWSCETLGPKSIRAINQKYDYFIAGSDQIWNPYYDFVSNEVDFLTFAPSNKRIAYAASFGIDNIPPNTKKQFKKWLKDFYKISVREIEGAKIIKELVDREPAVVLDPTLLLTASEWRRVYQPVIVPDDYVLVYSVDKMGNDLKETIEDIKKERVVINLRNYQMNGKECPIGPAEFLYLIDHASLLLTDSFHGTVFSLLFHTPFKIFQRPGIDMSSRINTLIKITKAENPDYTDSFWDDTDRNLDDMRKKSIGFLRSSLD